MKRLMILLAGVLPLHAQTPPQGVRTLAEDATRTFFFLVGSGTMTSATVHGKPLPIPHFDVGIAANLVGFSSVNPADTTKELKGVLFSPYLQAELGVFDGFSLVPGLLSGVGAVDVLVRYIPATKLSVLGSSVETPQGFGFGVKVGLLKDRLIPPVPGVSATIFHTTWGDLVSDYQEGSNYVGVRMKARVLRMQLDVSKNFLLFTPYAGIGYERGELTVDWRTTQGGPYSSLNEDFLKQGYTRAYVGVLLSPLPLVKAVGEVSFLKNRTGFTLGLKAGI